jgi:hypothetical protein
MGAAFLRHGLQRLGRRGGCSGFAPVRLALQNFPQSD